jgi:hypothetical protein
VIDEFADRPLALPQKVEDLLTAAIAQHLQCESRGHSPNITH